MSITYLREFVFFLRVYAKILEKLKWLFQRISHHKELHNFFLTTSTILRTLSNFVIPTYIPTKNIVSRAHNIFETVCLLLKSLCKDFGETEMSIPPYFSPQRVAQPFPNNLHCSSHPIQFRNSQLYSNKYCFPYP